MEEKPAELPISPQEVQIQPPNLLDKIKTHKFKILGGVLGVLVFVGAVFGAYKLGQRQVWVGPQPTPTPIVVATPTPDLTANWKTYKNEEAGISFKYPNDWTAEPFNVSGYAAYHGIANLKIKGREYGPEPGTVWITYWDNPDNLDLKEFEQKYTGASGKGPGLYYIEAEKSTISGVASYYTEKADCEPVFCSKYIVSYKNKIYDVAISGSASIEEGQIVNLILSTFKFLEESAYKCVEESSLNCAEEKELSFQCTEEYQTWARENCPGWEEKVYCQDPRPEVCTMECIVNPPYICGSDGKSYCNVCGACADLKVDWYVIQDKPCGT